MKQFLWVPVALLLGLVVGAWGPKSQLEHARSEVKRLEELLRKGGVSGSDRFDGITRMLKIPGADREPEEQAATADAPPATNAAQVAAQSNRSDTAALVSAAPGDDTGEQEKENRQGLAQRIDEAVELWRLRSDIVRSTFISNARLSPKDAMQFDVVVEAMNIRLGERIDAWAELMETEDFTMNEENGVRMMNELSDVMVLTYDEMDRKMPEDWRDSAGEEFNLTDMIDPSVATPLVGVEGKLGQRPRGRGPFRR